MYREDYLLFVEKLLRRGSSPKFFQQMFKYDKLVNATFIQVVVFDTIFEPA